MSDSLCAASPSRQYNLHINLVNDLLRLFEAQEDCDVMFLIDGAREHVLAHSSVIAARCKMLSSMIAERIAQKRACVSDQSPILKIVAGDVSVQALTKVLRYVYTGRISLEASDVYDVCTLSECFGVTGLQDIVFAHLRNTKNNHLIATVLNRALQNHGDNHSLITRLTQHLAQNCSSILKNAPLPVLSQDFIMHVIKQEDLGASELEIWQACITWSCERCGIVPAKQVSNMTLTEKRKVALVVQAFCGPGLIRILNFDATSFSSEVEPLGVFPEPEILMKYRFDATAGLAPFDQVFLLDRYNFLTRIRQRTMCFESRSHPHPRGVSDVVHVALPVWVSQARITFDPRTALGRHADLEFFADEEGSQRIFSLRASGQSHMSAALPQTGATGPCISANTIEPLLINEREFWFSFYAPQNVGGIAGWGYKFFVSIIR